MWLQAGAGLSAPSLEVTGDDSITKVSLPPPQGAEVLLLQQTAAPSGWFQSCGQGSSLSPANPCKAPTQIGVQLPGTGRRHGWETLDGVLLPKVLGGSAEQNISSSQERRQDRGGNLALFTLAQPGCNTANLPPKCSFYQTCSLWDGSSFPSCLCSVPCHAGGPDPHQQNLVLPCDRDKGPKHAVPTLNQAREAQHGQTLSAALPVTCLRMAEQGWAPLGPPRLRWSPSTTQGPPKGYGPP